MLNLQENNNFMPDEQSMRGVAYFHILNILPDFEEFKKMKNKWFGI